MFFFIHLSTVNIYCKRLKRYLNVFCLLHFKLAAKYTFNVCTIVILWYSKNQIVRSSHPEVFPGKGVLKICSKFNGEHPCRSVISIRLLCITLRHGCSPVNLLHIFRTLVPRNTSAWLLLDSKYFCVWLGLYWSCCNKTLNHDFKHSAEPLDFS